MLEFAKVVPLGFREGAEKCGDLGELILRFSPLEVLLESLLRLDGHGVMPGGENERKRRLPSAGRFLAGIPEQVVERVPLRRHRHQTVVGSAEIPEGIKCLVGGAHACYSYIPIKRDQLYGA